MSEEEHVLRMLAFTFARAIDKRVRAGQPGIPPNLRQQAARRKRLHQPEAM